MFQGAAVSSEHFSQSLPPRNVAELGGSPPLRGSLEQLDRPSPAGPPLQGTELAASKYTRDQSRETGSLSRLFGSMETAAKCVSMGHAHCRTRLCGALPQPFYGVTPMLVGPERTGGHERSKRCILLPHHRKFLKCALGAKRINIGFFPSWQYRSSHPVEADIQLRWGWMLWYNRG